MILNIDCMISVNPFDLQMRFDNIISMTPLSSQITYSSNNMISIIFYNLLMTSSANDFDKSVYLWKYLLFVIPMFSWSNDMFTQLSKRYALFYIYVKSCTHGKSNFHGCPIFPSRYFYAFNETGVPLTYSCAYYVTHSE